MTNQEPNRVVAYINLVSDEDTGDNTAVPSKTTSVAVSSGASLSEYLSTEASTSSSGGSSVRSRNSSTKSQPISAAAQGKNFATPSGGLGPLKIISLAEQKDLTATANQVERHRKSQFHRCKTCKVNVPRGWDSVHNQSTWHGHLNSARHKRAVELKFDNWQKGCPTCPGPIKFNCQSQYVAHLAGKKHARALRKLKHSECLQRLGKGSSQ